MIDDLIEAVGSLLLILDEENDRLVRPDFSPLPEALVAAKLRHAGVMEAAGLRLAEAGATVGTVDAAAAARLAGMIPDIVAKSQVNAGLLQRRIASCDELLGAIAAEARRLAGGRSTTYGARGTVSRNDCATPISINSSF